MTMRDSSRANWGTKNSIEHINAGSLQRIADACEKMAGNYTALQSERDGLVRTKDFLLRKIATLERRVAALRGHRRRAKGGD